MNDNNFPYELSKDSKIGGYEVSNFIVPLPPKIHVTVENLLKSSCTVKQIEKTRNKIFDEIKEEIGATVEIDPVLKNKILRLFLATSRSYVQHVIGASQIEKNFKEVFSIVPFPKFIYILEIIDKNELQEQKEQSEVEEVFIFDATESGKDDDKPFIFYLNTTKKMYSLPFFVRVQE